MKKPISERVKSTRVTKMAQIKKDYTTLLSAIEAHRESMDTSVSTMFLHLTAAVELLTDKGIISKEELQKHTEVVYKRMAAKTQGGAENAGE